MMFYTTKSKSALSIRQATKLASAWKLEERRGEERWCKRALYVCGLTSDALFDSQLFGDDREQEQRGLYSHRLL